ncbi:Phosphatidylinositol 3,5-bisphosphate-binding protein [Coemansia sp. RSA 2336]|nr:Phosphatidylinositol 3,5-bisphosphate-binding protein [Coemansia sp. RSA 2336]
MNIDRPVPRANSGSQEAFAPELLYAAFNQDYGCFAIGTQSGFRIFNSDPYKEKMRREFKDGGIGIVALLYRSNYLAFVGGGRNPQFPPNKVMLWDDATSKIVAELEFRSDVLNVQLKRERIVVALRNKCIVCSLEAYPRPLHTFETSDNNRGALAISGGSHSSILAFPGRQKGHIQIVDLKSCVSTAANSESSDTLPGAAAHRARSLSRGSVAAESSAPAASTVYPANINIIAAHVTAISALAVSADGSMVASASEKGTLIRIFDTVNGRLLHELRRGVDRADIYSIAFSPDNTRLCVSSDKGTVHIFNLEAKQNAAAQPPAPAASGKSGNRHSNLKFMKDLLPKYFSSEWSFAHFRVANEVRCICGFGNERNSVIVLCADGTAQKYSFDSFRGHCVPTRTLLPPSDSGVQWERLRVPIAYESRQKRQHALPRSITEISKAVPDAVGDVTDICCQSCKTSLLVNSLKASGLNVRRLPSAHWSELVDCWMCHPEEDKLTVNPDLLFSFEPERNVRQDNMPSANSMDAIATTDVHVWVGNSFVLIPQSCLQHQCKHVPVDDKPVEAVYVCANVIGEAGCVGSRKVLRLGLHRVQLLGAGSQVSLKLAQSVCSEILSHAGAHAVYKYVIEGKRSCKPVLLIHLVGWNADILTLQNFKDTPVFERHIKVLFLADSDSGFSERAKQWLEDDAVEVFSLLDDDCTSLSRQLTENSLQIPSPVRTMGNMSRSFLPQ